MYLAYAFRLRKVDFVHMYFNVTHPNTACNTVNFNALPRPQKLVNHGDRSIVGHFEFFHGRRAQNAIDGHVSARQRDAWKVHGAFALNLILEINERVIRAVAAARLTTTLQCKSHDAQPY